MHTQTGTQAAITARTVSHRGAEQIALRFPFDTEIKQHVQKLEGVRWSQTLRCFYVAYTPDNIRRLINHCRGVVWVDLKGMRTSASSFAQKQGSAEPNPIKSVTAKPDHAELSEECKALVNRTTAKMKLLGYSSSTLKNYTNHIRVFLRTIAQDSDPLLLTKDDIERYLLKKYETHPTSESDRNMHINAIKFLYEQVLGQERMLFHLPRPEKPLLLPKVLGEHELERVFRAVKNLKHKAILITAFSCGLRVSEVVRLRIRDIDSERMQIFIGRANGKKDRYVTLSPVLLDVLRQYLRTQTPRPEVYLFEGQKKGDPYSVRSAQTIFNRAVGATGIRKKVTFHALRHSYATHLLEKGVDIKYIKELLGHFDIKTTERYLHVAKDKLVSIPSPLDFLDRDI